MRKGELPSYPKRIAFYIVIKFQATPTETIRESISDDFEAADSGLVFAKPVFGNMIELAVDQLADYAWTRRAKAMIFLRKSNIEQRLGVRFSK